MLFWGRISLVLSAAGISSPLLGVLNQTAPSVFWILISFWQICCVLMGLCGLGGLLPVPGIHAKFPLVRAGLMVLVCLKAATVLRLEHWVLRLLS